MKTYSIKVKGKVQGVWYRKSTQNKALELGLNGMVQNKPDGSVYIEVQGEIDRLKALIAWCYEGPPHARVDAIEATEIDEKPYRSFDILR